MQEGYSVKVQELRATMKGAPPTFLQNALVEAYKLIPKAKKDEADEKIRAILQGEAPPAKPAPKKPEVIFSDLSQDIETFLENAYDQNYFAPNRTVPKAQRSRWRFTVKRFFADLEKISPDSPDYPAAADLYARLYAVLCEGCQMWLFSSDDPFKSIESSQEDLFTRLGHYVLQSGCTEENLRLLIPLACREGHSRESWSGSALPSRTSGERRAAESGPGDYPGAVPGRRSPPLRNDRGVPLPVGEPQRVSASDERRRLHLRRGRPGRGEGLFPGV